MKLSELNLTIPENTIPLEGFDGVEVKTFLPVQDKMDLIQGVLGKSLDDSGYYIPLEVTIYEALYIISYYTNIELENDLSISNTYDILISSGLYEAVCDAIGDDFVELDESIHYTIEKIYEYRNSAHAIIDSLSNESGNLAENVVDLVNKLKSAPEGLDLVKATVDKLS